MPFSLRKGGIVGNWDIYLFLLPSLILLICFIYLPMYGVQIAFKDFTPRRGIWGSPWVAFKHFRTFFSSFQFKNVIINTISLNLYSIIVGFPFPVILAILLNQIRVNGIKKTMQVIVYLPHFISTVVMVGILLIILSPRNGLFGNLWRLLINNGPPNLMGMVGAFQSIYVWSNIWQNTGWDSIIYLATLSSIDLSLYEAAVVDGANKFQKIIHIDIPFLIPTAIILLILRTGNIMNIGFEKVYLMQNPMNTSISEVISTYVYKMGLIQNQYSLSSAVGLFNNLINLVILILVNQFSRKISETSLW